MVDSVFVGSSHVSDPTVFRVSLDGQSVLKPEYVGSSLVRLPLQTGESGCDGRCGKIVWGIQEIVPWSLSGGTIHIRISHWMI